MTRLAPLLLLSAPLYAQGGRGDSGEGAPLVLFVRSERTTESKEIYDAAWKALEPHFGKLARERMKNLDGERRRAEVFFAGHPRYRTVVCFDAASKELCPDGDKVVLVEPRADRREVGRVIRLLRPLARRVYVFGQKEELPGFELVDDPAEADVAWVTEDHHGKLPELNAPLVSTSPRHDGVVTIRPDPRGVGLQLAAQLLYARKERRPVTRQRVVVDMGAARRRLPLRLLARADLLRRAP